MDAFSFRSEKQLPFVGSESGMYIIDSPTSSETRRGIPEVPIP